MGRLFYALKQEKNTFPHKRLFGKQEYITLVSASVAKVKPLLLEGIIGNTPNERGETTFEK